MRSRKEVQAGRGTSIEPPFPHEKENPSQVDGRLAIGLAGIQSMILDEQLPFDSINDADVQTHHAAHAVQEMNGFPAWLEGLANARPAPVAEVLSACVRGEWQYPADARPLHAMTCLPEYRG